MQQTRTPKQACGLKALDICKPQALTMLQCSAAHIWQVLYTSASISRTPSSQILSCMPCVLFPSMYCTKACKTMTCHRSTSLTLGKRMCILDHLAGLEAQRLKAWPFAWLPIPLRSWRSHLPRHPHACSVHLSCLPSCSICVFIVAA